MKVHLTTPHVGRKTCAMTEPVSGRKPVLGLLLRLLWAAVLTLPIFGARAAAVLTNLHSFAVFTNGEFPAAGLVQGSDGNFYGTTQSGGTGGAGTVFKISANGMLTSLYSFSGGKDGGNLWAGLVQGSDGNLYGTTSGGGAYTNQYGGCGTVFKISTNGALTSLHSFTGGNDGAGPQAALVQGSDGNFYGTTEQGGTNGGNGTVFKMSTTGALTSLYSFTGGRDGGGPLAAVVQGTDGNFYGTTEGGGARNVGTVFKISANGMLTSLYSFSGGNDGGNPYAGLVQGNDGNFYGTTAYGGTNNAGTVFKISANGMLTSLYSFTGGNDGGNPEASLVQGTDGNFYGTTEDGGMYVGPYGNTYGTVFKISTTGALTTLHSFGAVTNAIGVALDGASRQAALVQGSDGNFYGTTGGGGTNNAGTVFKISANGMLTNLYSFTGANDGASPQAALVQGKDGYFYGTTFSGVTTAYGTVFKISANGALTSLYSFGGNDGRNPFGGLVQGSDGNFYGTTIAGGTDTNGTVFEISANGALTSLYSFTGGNDGGNPFGGLVQGSDGNLYGTTQNGGTNGIGIVFKIGTDGELTTLYAFGAVTNANGYPLDGAYPEAALVQGSDGNFYGTTGGGGPYDEGTVFKITADGTLTSLYSFTGGKDGGFPYAGLVQGSDGNFYGTTYTGGAATNQYGAGIAGFGTVFRISTNGALTTLYLFTGGNDGGFPYAGLVQGSDGSFYGTTYTGGTNNAGTVFQISSNGTLTSLYSFTGGNDGGAPQAELVQGSDGSFYGTTYGGGLAGAGTVFRLTIVPEFQTVTLTDSTLSLTWSTEAGGTYQLQYTSNLSSSNWTNLGSPVTATGATLSTTDSLTNGPQRFYRLVLAP
jgi:uncharacterized repeat protein (TIGR03803 family)